MGYVYPRNEKMANKKQYETTQEEIKEIFEVVGAEHGYDYVDVRFARFSSFKVRWMRSYKWVSFSIPYAMRYAPADIVEQIARTLYPKFEGKCTEMPDTVRDWVEKNRYKWTGNVNEHQ